MCVCLFSDISCYFVLFYFLKYLVCYIAIFYDICFIDLLFIFNSSVILLYPCECVRCGVTCQSDLCEVSECVLFLQICYLYNDIN